MKTKIEKLDNLYRAGGTPTAEQLKALGFHPVFGWHYLQSRIDENEVIDFNDFFDSDIEGIARDLKANGIHAFTISQQAARLLDKVDAFTKHGAKLEGFTKIHDGCGGKMPALKMSI